MTPPLRRARILPAPGLLRAACLLRAALLSAGALLFVPAVQAQSPQPLSPPQAP